MRALILAGSLALFTAAPATAEQMPPPTPESVAVRVSADQSGTSVGAAVGDQIAVELQSSASAGSWALSEQPSFLSEPTTATGPTRTSATGRPLLGAPRWQVWVFTVTEPGTGEVLLTKLGPVSSSTSTPAETFRVSVVAQ